MLTIMYRFMGFCHNLILIDQFDSELLGRSSHTCSLQFLPIINTIKEYYHAYTIYMYIIFMLSIFMNRCNKIMWNRNHIGYISGWKEMMKRKARPITSLNYVTMLWIFVLRMSTFMYVKYEKSSYQHRYIRNL